MSDHPSSNASDCVLWFRRPGSVALLGAVIASYILWQAYADPTAPLLTYWMAFVLVPGLVMASFTRFRGLRHRTAYALTVTAVAVFLGLLTTQIAARQKSSSTHLGYDGVLIERDTVVRIGAMADGVNVQLPAVRQQLFPWIIRVAKRGGEWVVEPESNVDQLRLSTGGEENVLRRFLGDRSRRWELGGAARLISRGDRVTVLGADGVAVDTLTLTGAGNDRRLASVNSGVFALSPVEKRTRERYRRGLRAGLPLSSLDGSGRTSAPFERFVRVREDEAPIGWRSVLAGFLAGLFEADKPLLVTAAAPFRLQGPSVRSATMGFRDSALVQVKQGAVVWQFRLVEWRRTASSGRGLALLFQRLPRRLDTPLPAGENCARGAACAVLSTRPLPAPISYVSLSQAGFPPARFGLLGRLVAREGGFDVVLPRDSIRVNASALRPVAVPVQALDASGQQITSEAPRHWVLVSASSGIGDNVWQLVVIALGIVLLIVLFDRAVSSVEFRNVTVTVSQAKAIGLGITALSGLLLARTIVGARVAFFAPYLARGLETVIGMWIAITIVAAMLLAWPAWMPVVLQWARDRMTGSTSRVQVRRLLASLSRGNRPALLIASALPLGLLAMVAAGGVTNALVASALVLLAWATVAWVVALASPQEITFSRASDVLTAISPTTALMLSDRRCIDRWTGNAEVVLACTCVAAAVALWMPWPLAAVASVAVLVFSVGLLSRATERRARRARVALLLPAAYVFFTAIIKMGSANGSLATLVFVVFVTLVSIRFGCMAAMRAESRARSGRFQARGQDSAQLLPRWMPDWSIPLLPVLLLFPLTLLDMGLFLVMLVPIGFSATLAAGDVFSRWRTLLAGLGGAAVLLGVISLKVLFPSVEEIRRAETHEAKAVAFERMGLVLGLRIPGISESLARVASRGVATRDRALAEELLVSAAPGRSRDLLMPSIEQIWGAAAYSSAGLQGAGLGGAIVGDRGVAEAVSYAENSYAVYVLAEHGWLGGSFVLLSYLFLTVAVGALIWQSRHNRGVAMRAIRALFLVAALIVVVPAVYVALSNLGTLPITGQNMPFLGLNAWSDVAICAGVIGMLVTAAIHNTEGRV